MANKDHIIFIGMGDWDIPQLDIARERGYVTIVTNRNPQALALQSADIPIVADGHDIEGILRFLSDQNLTERVAAIYTGTELFASTAIIGQVLGIPWHTPSAALACEHKNMMRAKFISAGVPCPDGWVIEKTSTEAPTLDFTGGRKYIFKPADSLSALGVTIVKTTDDVPAALELARSVSATDTIICEEYIEGTLHDINGILTANGLGELVGLGISDKTAGPPPHAVVISANAPTSLSATEQTSLYALFEQSCQSVGLGPGPVKGDFIRDGKGKMYAMEVAPRLHGPLGSLYLIPSALGINPFEQLINYYQGENLERHVAEAVAKKVVKTVAAENHAEAKRLANVTHILEKEGVRDRNKWQSNNDVPVYAVVEEQA